jgi:hypothetical protein
MCKKLTARRLVNLFPRKEAPETRHPITEASTSMHKLTASSSILPIYRCIVSASFVRHPSQRSSSGVLDRVGACNYAVRAPHSPMDVTPHQVPGSLRCSLCRREDEQAFLNDPCPAELMLMSMLGSKVEDGSQGCSVLALRMEILRYQKVDTLEYEKVFKSCRRRGRMPCLRPRTSRGAQETNLISCTYLRCEEYETQPNGH